MSGSGAPNGHRMGDTMGLMDPTVVVVDDSRAFRGALADLVDAADGFSLVGEAASGEEGVALVEELRPDLALIDDRLAGIDGVEAAARIAALGLPTLVVLLTAGDAVALGERARPAGAAAVVDKQRLRPSVLQEIWEARETTDGNPAEVER